MPAAREKVVKYDDFTAGEFGDLGAEKAPQRSFTGRNVLRYFNGLVGPRPGLKRVEPAAAPPTGGLLGFYTVARSPGVTSTELKWDVIYVVGTSVRAFRHDTLDSVTLGSIAAVPANGFRVPMDVPIDKAYITSLGDKSYELTLTGAGGLAALTSSPGGRTIALYGARLIVASPNIAQSYRLYYSEPNNFNSWPALNFIDVGTDVQKIYYVQEIRNRLAIAAFFHNEWWALSGVPGVNDTLRRQSRGQAAPDRFWAASRSGDSVWFTPAGFDYPVNFSSSVTDRLRWQHLRASNGETDDIAAAAASDTNDVIFTTGGVSDKMLAYIHETFTAHEFAVPISSHCGYLERGRYMISDGGGTGVAAKFYGWEPRLNRPGKVGDSWANPGDDSETPVDASMYLPEWWSEDGSLVNVRSVVVDFAKWDTGATESNHLDVTVRCFRRDDQEGFVDSTVQSFDEPTADTPADETSHRMVFRVGNQGVGNGWQVRFDNMRGVAIRRVQVVIEVDTHRGN